MSIGIVGWKESYKIADRQASFLGEALAAAACDGVTLLDFASIAKSFELFSEKIINLKSELKELESSM